MIQSEIIIFSGGKAIAVPGELAGYWEAHQKYGKLPWKDLFEPTIALCDEGILINEYIADRLRDVEPLVRNQPSLAELFLKSDGTVLGVGDRFRRPKLMETLKLIAEHGAGIFYNGTMGEKLVEEIRGFGGIITMDDLRNYRPKWKEPIKAQLGNHTLITSPVPGSGLVLQFILRVLHGLVPADDDKVFWARMMESFKWGYAGRSHLGDDDFEDMDSIVKSLTSESYIDKVRTEIVKGETHSDPKHYGMDASIPDDAGTTQMAVLAPDGSAVSVTSTINRMMGAMRRSVSTGIIFNDQMDDFSIPGFTNGYGFPPSPENFIKPGKRPMSSSTPTIVVDSNNEVQLVIGAAGGSRIINSVAQAIVLNLWSGFDIKQTIDYPRIHHQLLPMKIDAEKGFPVQILHQLEDVGHVVEEFTTMGASMIGISRVNRENITANADYRRQGGVAGF